MCCSSDGVKRVIDSVKTIGLKDVGAVSKESHVMKSDEHTGEFENVGQTSAVDLTPGLLREWRQTEIDFVNQSDVHRNRPRQ